MELMHEVLQVSTPAYIVLWDGSSTLSFQEPATAKQMFSSAHKPTVWHTIPVLEFLLQSWENMAELSKISKVGHVIHKGLRNIDKWYCKVNDTDAYFICFDMLFFYSELD
jgi:hypothetical protein